MNAKNIMRVVALLLVAVVAIGIFAGCNSTETKPASTTAATQPGTQAGTTAGTTAGVVIPDELTLDILVCNDSNNDDFHKRENYNVWAPFVEMCEAKNLTIEWEIVEKDQYAATLQGYLAGDIDDLPDAFWMTESELPTALRVQAIETGRLTALEDILPFSDGTASGFYAAFPAYQARTAYTDGKTYWVGEYQEVVYYGQEVDLGGGAAKGLTIRLDWYNKLVADGHWEGDIPNTAEELTAFLEACNEYDMNGDGIRNEYYLNYVADITAGVGNLFGVPRTHFAVNLKTGTIDSPWNTGDVEGMLNMLIDWVEKGYIPEDMVGGKSGSTKYRTGNKTAVYNAYFCDNWGFSNCVVPEGADMAIVVGVLPDTTVHPGAYIANDSAPSMDNRSFAFTSNLSHPAAAAALLDILCSDEFEELMVWGTENESFAVVDGNKIYINGADDLSNSHKTFITYGRELFGFYVMPYIGSRYDLLSDEQLCLDDKSGVMLEIFQEAMTWEKIYPDQKTTYLATPTAEEADRLTELEGDFIEVSETIFYDIVTGEREYNAEEVMAELEEAGFSEIKAIYQARLDRFMEVFEATK